MSGASTLPSSGSFVCVREGRARWSRASTAAAIRVVTCGGGGEVLDRQDAAACRSCACEDDKTEGGCCRQDRCRAGPAEARRAGRAAAGVLRPGGTLASGAEVWQRGGQRACEAATVGHR